MNHTYALKKTQGILLFLFTILNTLCAILDCFQPGLFPYYIGPTIASFLTILFAFFLLFKKDIDGAYYARFLMVTMVAIASSLLLDGLMAIILTKSLSFSLIIPAILVLFAICLAKNNAGETSWQILNYIGFGLLALSAIASLVVLLIAGLGLVPSLASVPTTNLGHAIFAFGIGYLVSLLGFSIVSLILTKDQPIL
jgi:hypothetical protein